MEVHVQVQPAPEALDERYHSHLRAAEACRSPLSAGEESLLCGDCGPWPISVGPAAGALYVCGPREPQSTHLVNLDEMGLPHLPHLN